MSYEDFTTTEAGKNRVEILADQRDSPLESSEVKKLNSVKKDYCLPLTHFWERRLS